MHSPWLILTISMALATLESSCRPREQGTISPASQSRSTEQGTLPFGSEGEPELNPAEAMAGEEKADDPSTSTDLRFFTNPVLNVGADPWVVIHNGRYYRSYSNGNDSIWVSSFDRLEGMRFETATKVWQAPAGTAYSKDTWAPEMHLINGHWYMYFAASDGTNESHQVYVLESASDDPKSTYTLKGKIAAPSNRWAIDATVLTMPGGSLYLVWSGWDGANNIQQNLYIAPMTNPWTVAGSPGDSQRYEAESMSITDAKARTSSTASGGQAVGLIDLVTSNVNFQINVAQSGLYQIDIRYSNGTTGPSTHFLSVDGQPATTVTYPSTVSWENWQSVSLRMNLAAGAHQVRLTKGSSFAELDALELKISGKDRLVVSVPEFDWERQGGPPYVNEGPQILKRNNKIYLVYSASGTWTDDYALGLITLEGTDPLDPRAWQKAGKVFSKTDKVFGPGHCSFTRSLDGSEDWLVYHAARSQGAGMDRNLRIQKFTWDASDRPVFAAPLPPGTPFPVPR